MPKCLLILIICFSTLTLASPAPSVPLRDKIGQMLLIGFDGKRVNAESFIVKAIADYNLGGVILFDYNLRRKNHNKNIESPAQLKQLTQDLQAFNQQAQRLHHRPPLPLFIAVDAEGGKVNRLKSRYGFPAMPSAAETGKQSLQAAETTAKTMASTLKAVGINLNFAPLLDLNINPDNPVIGKKDRSFSRDPLVVSRYATLFSQEFLKQNIQCAYKHFPGHGSASQDSHEGFVDVTASWQPAELIPYQRLLSQPNACGIIMSAHLINRQLDKSGLPATLSHAILTDLLRRQLHFTGIIITDDMQMKAISDHFGLERALVLAINAGADMLIFGNNFLIAPQDPKQLIDIIEEKVRSGEIKEERINDAYQRIVELKQSMGR